MTLQKLAAISIALGLAVPTVVEGSEISHSDWSVGAPIDTRGLDGTRLAAAEEQIDIGLLVEVVQHVHIIAEHSGLRIHRNAGRQLLRGGTIVDDDELSGLNNLGRIFPDTPLF